MSTYSEKTAIVTGASSGIGRASAEALARAGFTVFGKASSADTLSIGLAGHRKLKNDLRRPSIEEIGSRATIFEL